MTAQTNPPVDNRYCSTSEARPYRRHAARENPVYESGREQLLPFGKNVTEGKEAGAADFGPTPEWISGTGELPMRVLTPCKTGSLILASPLSQGVAGNVIAGFAVDRWPWLAVRNDVRLACPSGSETRLRGKAAWNRIYSRVITRFRSATDAGRDRFLGGGLFLRVAPWRQFDAVRSLKCFFRSASYETIQPLL